jgi:hypothetical protein
MGSVCIYEQFLYTYAGFVVLVAEQSFGFISSSAGSNSLFTRAVSKYSKQYKSMLENNSVH